MIARSRKLVVFACWGLAFVVVTALTLIVAAVPYLFGFFLRLFVVAAARGARKADLFLNRIKG